MNVALVYDRVNKIGGAEHVLAALHELYPDAPLFTAVYHKERAPWAKSWDVRPSFLNRLPWAASTHELYAWLAPLAFESIIIEGFDLVISVTSADAKGIITKPKTLHLCYLLTPTRYLWSDADLYRKALPTSLRPMAKPIFSYLRAWDKIAGQRPDYLVAISSAVRERIQTYYHRDAAVIYPPVDVESFKSKRDGDLPYADYFLVVSRLVPHKRIDLAIAACNALKIPLVIVGTGWQVEMLRSQAGPTISFVSQLTDEMLVLYYQKCRALIFPQEEDFGIAAVEAQAAGRPVIAYNRGGATEIIRTGKTGLFFSQQTSASLIRALQRFDHEHFKPEDCQENAKRFSKSRFMREFSSKVAEIWRNHTTSFQ